MGEEDLLRADKLLQPLRPGLPLLGRDLVFPALRRIVKIEEELFAFAQCWRAKPHWVEPSLKEGEGSLAGQ